ncbi:hypothetical protein [Bacteroides sp.]|uniref:hypothetical protein n=1 Tax=Bacteroides sp. TaxID=29523 RepID=UPI0025908AB1|nr:hypothetical protein [Bacteroides sp.]
METRRLKYDLAPANLIASVKGKVNLGSYNPDRLNINKQDVRLSQPKVSSCTVMEIPVDSIIWKPVSFEDVTYHVGEYKKFQLTPMKAGKVEIPHFWYDCTLSRWGANLKFANGIGNAHGLLGVIGAAVTVVSTSPVRLEKRNESVHTDPLYLEVLP